MRSIVPMHSVLPVAGTLLIVSIFLLAMPSISGYHICGCLSVLCCQSAVSVFAVVGPEARDAFTRSFPFGVAAPLACIALFIRFDQHDKLNS
jgi:hypothetical protein